MVAAFLLRADGPSRVAVLLAGTLVLELGGFLAIRTRGPLTALRGRAPARAYVLAVVIAAAYIGLTLAGNPAARDHLLTALPLKALAVAAAGAAGLFEETLFRGLLMDQLERSGRGRAVQVLASGLIFGLAHFYVFAGLQSALLAQVATSVLGVALAALRLLSKRTLWPCVVAHTVIDAVLEPALLLSFIR